MKVLLLIEDPLLRDQVRAGLSASPGIEITCPSTPRRRMGQFCSHFDWIWFEKDPNKKEENLQKIREHNPDAFLVILGDEKTWKWLEPLKDKWKIGAFLKKPLNPKEFFRTVDRLRTRLLARQKT